MRVVVLVVSHIAIARPVMYATDLYATLVDNAGDESEIIAAEELVDLTSFSSQFSVCQNAFFANLHPANSTG